MNDEQNVIELDPLEHLLNRRMLAYLAGPLTGVSIEHEAECRKIRTIAKRILSARFRVYDPADHTSPGTVHDAQDVFETDHTQIADADLVFCHVNAPSLGVGIEAQIAAEATIPRVIAYPSGRPISRMFEGLFNPTIARIEYADTSDFDVQLSKFLTTIAEAASISSKKRRPIIANVRNARCGESIFKARVLLGISIKQLSHRTDISESMLRRLERDNSLACMLTGIHLMRIAQELNSTLALSAGVPVLYGPDEEPAVDDVRRQSLASLYQYLRGKQSWVSDDHVFSAWHYAFPDIGSGQLLAARGGDPTSSKQPIGTESWEQIFVDISGSADEPTLF